jgi:hypothetical protein
VQLKLLVTNGRVLNFSIIRTTLSFADNEQVVEKRLLATRGLVKTVRCRIRQSIRRCFDKLMLYANVRYQVRMSQRHAILTDMRLDAAATASYPSSLNNQNLTLHFKRLLACSLYFSYWKSKTTMATLAAERYGRTVMKTRNVIMRNLLYLNLLQKTVQRSESNHI